MKTAIKSFLDSIDLYPNNSLVVLTLFGVVVIKKGGYTKEWNGDNLNSGTYYNTFIINDGEQENKGFTQIVRYIFRSVGYTLS